MINRVHIPTMEINRHNDPSGRIIVVLAFSLVVLGFWVGVGIGCWFMEGMLGVLGLAWGPWG